MQAETESVWVDGADLQGVQIWMLSITVVTVSVG